MSLAQLPVHSRKSNRGPAPSVRTTRKDTTLRRILSDMENSIAPVWPLQDYVAVNPFTGMSHKSFLQVRHDLQAIRHCEMLMPMDFYRDQYIAGRFTNEDVASALDVCRAEYPELYGDIETSVILDSLRTTAGCSEGGDSNSSSQAERSYLTAAQWIDRKTGSNWNAAIVDEVSRHLSAYYDQGQAVWINPWKTERLFTAWLETVRIEHRMRLLGVKCFAKLVASLPNDPFDAIRELLSKVEVPEEHIERWLTAELHTVTGWAAWIKQRIGQLDRSAQTNKRVTVNGATPDDFVALLAIRLAYDVALLEQFPDLNCSELMPEQTPISFAAAAARGAIDAQTVVRYTLQSAIEAAYRRNLARQLVARATADSSNDLKKDRLAAQIVMCIDVRSEMMRRHLESASNRIETLGFAGFFGLAFELHSLGEPDGRNQCPVLIQPSIQLEERLVTHDVTSEGTAVKERRAVRLYRRAWKSFQSSAASTFSFVETLGLWFAPKLLTNSLALTRPTPAHQHDGILASDREHLTPSIEACSCHGMSHPQQIQSAEAILRNLGLTQNFATFVVLCGHECNTVNNPYQAALNCGACGGHSGAANALAAASLFNSPHVRSGLTARGIHIPDDCVFVAAVHDTTVDTITILNESSIPPSHSTNLSELKTSIIAAQTNCRSEREGSYVSGHNRSADRISSVRRSCDWSEVRPEWGLAGNAAFIAAPRSRTAGLDLGGRAFLHNYDYRTDDESKVLELIMTAPMVVANWINLQYFASTVDNKAFGSGNKAIHNVVGQFGILQGNGGDLMTGLPWQSVHDGKSYRHEPLRLWVVIEAPPAKIQSVINSHPQVRQLIDNGWLSLAALHDKQIIEYRCGEFAASYEDTPT
ncbi:MAG: DUF2309 domain-containing protein [Pirellulales bacterium]